MKYTRMLCWVRPHEKKELKKAIGNKFPMVFAKNYDDFQAQIKEGDYLIFSIVKVAKNFKKCQHIVRSFPKYIFYLYYRDIGITTNNELDMFLEENVYQGQQTIDGILYGLGISAS